MDKIRIAGKTYVAKTNNNGYCSGCAFMTDDLYPCDGSFCCQARKRKDGREIIWVEEEEAAK